MPEDPLNPYAPPSEESISSDAQGVWRVEGDYLVVREGTVLPEVDVDGHGKGGPLTPIAMKLSVPLDGKGIAVNLIAVLPMLGYGVYQAMRGGRISWLWMMGIWLTMTFVLRGVKVRTSPALVYGYISVPAIRGIAGRDRLRWRLTVALLIPTLVIFPLVAAYPSMTGRYDLTMDAAKLAGGIVGVALLLLLGVAIWKETDKRWRCPRFSDGWLWIKGLGPEALAALGARAVGYVPVPVKKKVFTARLDLMPDGFWRRALGTGLLGKFRLWSLRRRTKGGPIEYLAFHWSESERLPPAAADPELLAAWRVETSGTPLAEWALAYEERIDTPGGFTRVILLLFLSPDGKHAASCSLTRAVTDRKLNETRDLNFRSYTTGGRIIATATNEALELLPPEVDFSVATGKPMEVAHAHLQRAAGEDLISMNADELKRQQERELRLTHQVMEEAGISGPTEERDFFRP
ncbi:MAG: hypothetical protein EOP83_16615 [Verrucomicrobiaceae bacterium]|nr:MAG: hypothetical protein EOP83_16615 [Verrucomicrobiaceae bacterium]